MLQRMNAWIDRQHILIQLLVIISIVFFIRTFFFGLYQVPTGSMETTMLVGEYFFADKLTPMVRTFKRGDIIAFNDPKYEYSENPFVNVWQRYVWGPSNWTKRIIGLPGEHIEGKIEDGVPVVYVNGVKLDEPYLNKYPIIAVWERMPESLLNIDDRASLTYRSYDPSLPFDRQPFYKIDPSKLVMHPLIKPIKYPHTPLDMGGSDVFDVHLGPDEYWMMGDNRLGSHDSRGWGPLKRTLIHGRILFRLLSIDSQESWLILNILKHPLAFWSQVRWGRCMNVVR